MPALVLKQMPADLYRRRRAAARAHGRSLPALPLATLDAALADPAPSPPKPGLEAVIAWLQGQVWTLPVLDHRGEDGILGDGPDGQCH